MPSPPRSQFYRMTPYLSRWSHSVKLKRRLFWLCNLLSVTIQISSQPQTKKKRADTHRKPCEHLPSGMEILKFHPNDPAYVDVSHRFCASVFKSCAISGFCSKRISNAVSAFSSSAELFVISSFCLLSICEAGGTTTTSSGFFCPA